MKDNRNRNLIIIVVVVVVLCLCCSGLSGAWFFGDSIMSNLGF
jgi:hypothetical protein